MMLVIRPWMSLPLLLALAGCVAAAPTGASGASAYPAPMASGGINALFGGPSSAEIADNLNNPVAFAFPVRMGILLYDYQPAMTPEDLQAALKGVQADLAASSLVRSSTVIPTALVAGNASLEDLRRIASRFHLDALFVISGKNSFLRSSALARGFFDSFSNASAFDARTELTAIGMNVLTGRFLPPLVAVGKEGPTVQNPDDANYAASSYAQRQKAEVGALKDLDGQLVANLQATKGNPPPPTPTLPPVAPTAQPSAQPSASASLSPSP